MAETRAKRSGAASQRGVELGIATLATGLQMGDLGDGSSTDDGDAQQAGLLRDRHDLVQRLIEVSR